MNLSQVYSIENLKRCQEKINELAHCHFIQGSVTEREDGAFDYFRGENKSDSLGGNWVHPY